MLCKHLYNTSAFFYLDIVIRPNTYLTFSGELELEFEKVIWTDLLLRVVKHLFYIIFCDFNFSNPELTAEHQKILIAAEIIG